MGCEYAELLTCHECGCLDRADQIIYCGHECNPEARSEHLVARMLASLENGEILRAAENWLQSTPAARNFYDYAVYRRDHALGS